MLVLVVNPEKVQAETLGMALEAAGHSVLHASTTLEVQGLAHESGAQVSVTEWSVPGLEGEALFKLLATGGRPVVLFTSREPLPPSSPHLVATLAKTRRDDLLTLLPRLIPSPASETATGVLAGPYTGRQALIIEDSPTIRGIVRRALTSGLQGLVVREAMDGKAALHELGQGRVHLIVTDLQMPGMDGWAFLAAVRQNAILKTKPIIVFSSAINPELRERFKDDTRMRFLDKPSSGETLARTARELLGQAA